MKERKPFEHPKMEVLSDDMAKAILVEAEKVEPKTNLREKAIFYQGVKFAMDSVKKVLFNE